MATRLIGTDSTDPRLPQGVIDATQGTTAADLAAGDTLTQAVNYTDAAIASGGIGTGGETIDTGELYRVIMFSNGDVRAIPIAATAPATPTGLARTITINSVKLTWSSAAGSDSYLVYRNGSHYATTTATTYIDGSVTVAETYTYAVLGANNYGLRSALSTSCRRSSTRR